MNNKQKRITRNQIRAKVNKLITACNFEIPPVKLATVVKHLNIFVDKGLTDFLDSNKVSAFIDLESRILEYNDNHPTVRKRFSVAHEIGHLVLGHSVKNDIFSYNSRNPIEVEANIFAAELLMPFKWLKEDLGKYNAKIDKLAHKYWVSKEAMGWRISNSDSLIG